MPESGTRRREQLAVNDFRHQMVGYVEQILIRRAAFKSLRSFHSRRITLLSCVRDFDATATLNHVGAVGGAE